MSMSLSTLPNDEESDPETDDILRETTLLLLRLMYARALSQLDSMSQEMELLTNAPPPPPLRPSEETDGKGKGREESDIWKLDSPSTKPRQGPVLDSSGKVCLATHMTISIQRCRSRCFVPSRSSHQGHRPVHNSKLKYLLVTITCPQ